MIPKNGGRVPLCRLGALGALCLLLVSSVAAARPLDAAFDAVEPVATSFSATDAYAGSYVDTCVNVIGDAIALPAGDARLVGVATEAGVPVIVYPTNNAAPDPCCLCGIYDPVSGSVKGCIAFGALAGQCCCRASIHTSGQINCECQGGAGCGADLEALNTE